MTDTGPTYIWVMFQDRQDGLAHKIGYAWTSLSLAQEAERNYNKMEQEKPENFRNTYYIEKTTLLKGMG